MNSIYPNLVKRMTKLGTSYEDIANLIGVSDTEISQKMLGTIPWTLAEAVKICCYFCTSDVNFLFLQLDTNT